MAKYKKRADGRYCIMVYLGKDENGKKIQKAVYGKTIKETEQKAEEIKALNRKGIDVSAMRDTFEHWYDIWISGKTCGNGQITSYKACAKHLLPTLGNMEISKIRTSDIQQILNSLAKSDKPLSHKTMTQIRMVAKQIFQLAIDNRVLDYNPAVAVKIPVNVPEAEEREALTDEQIKWVREFEHRAQLPAMIMLYCGLRRGEVLALRWNDISLTDRTITVSRSVEMNDSGKAVEKDGAKSKAGARTVPIPDILYGFLAEHKPKPHGKAIIEFNPLVCPNTQGDLMSSKSWQNLWSSYMTDLNLRYGHKTTSATAKYSPKEMPMLIKPFTAHQLRHTYATLLYEAGVDVLTAQRLLGHANVETTLGIYTHLRDKQADSQIEKFNAYLSGDVDKLNSSQN